MFKNLKSMTTEELERKMKDSDLFMIDAVDSPGMFQREKNKMIELIFEYGDRIWNRKERLRCEADESYSIELLELAERCIKYYDPSTGTFVNYLKGALKREKKWLDIKSTKERQYYVNERVITDDDGELSFWDLQSGDVDIENMFVELENIIELFKFINAGYMRAMIKSKPILSALITNDVLGCVCEPEVLSEMVFMDFYDPIIAADIYSRGKGFSQKEIGERFGKSAENTNQIYGRFKEQLQNDRTERRTA